MTTLHEACYRGALDVVRDMLGRGSHAAPLGLGCVRPLNCVAIAHAITKEHVEIARVLLAHGAIVDESVQVDFAADSVGGPEDEALAVLLGVL